MNVNILRFPNIRCLLNSLHLLKSVAECMKAFLYGLYVLLTSLMLFFSSSVLFSCAYAAENTGSDKAWTVMVYMCADNDLEEMALYDFLEMEQGIHEDVNVIVLMDRARGYSSLYGDDTGTKLYQVKKAKERVDYTKLITGAVRLPASFESEMILNLGELDMSDPANIVHFVNECVKRYPAQRYAFIPWNHGGGWKSMIMDNDGGKGVRGRGDMTVYEFAGALNSAAKLLPKKRFDAIIFEMCLMGQIDVLDVLAPYADYAFASPPVMPAVGISFTDILPLFTKDIPTADLVKKIVLSSKDYLEKHHLLECAYSAYDLKKTQAVTDSLNKLSSYLKGIIPKEYSALTRILGFTTHVNSVETDVLYGKPAYWSLSLIDFLNSLERNIPGIKTEYLQNVREALSSLIISSESTENAKELGGISIYLPMRREFLDTRYLSMEFAKRSGFGEFLDSIYRAQENRGGKSPRIDHVEVGTVTLKEGRDGRSPMDFNLKPVTTIKPFDRSVIRFDVTGEDILWTHLYQLEKTSNGSRIHFTQLVRDTSRRTDNASAGYLQKSTPHYENGTTHLMREITAQKYVITNGITTADISIQNTATSDAFNDNVSIGYAKYIDPDADSQELFIKLKFNNRTRLMCGAEVINQAGGGLSGTAINLKPNGILRPSLSYIDKKGNILNEFGAPFQVGSYLVLSLALVDNNAELNHIIFAQTVGGKKAIAVSKAVRIQRDTYQDSLIDNTVKNGLVNLYGRYALFQYAMSGSGSVLLPNFRILSLGFDKNNSPVWLMHDSGGEELGHGRFNFIVVGTPQLMLHLPHSNSTVPMLGPTLQSYYCFMEGQGPSRQWYFIGMGDGNRSLLLPIETFESKSLDGTWVSPTEIWKFKGSEVEQYRIREKLKAKGAFTRVNNLLKARNMPFEEYCYYIDRNNAHLTLISRDGHVSTLTRKDAVQVTENINPQGTVPKGDKPVENIVPSDNNVVKPSFDPTSLEGRYMSGADTGNAFLTIQRLQSDNRYSAYMQTKGQGNIRFVFTVKDSDFWAVFPNGERQKVGFRFQNGYLTLFFDNMPPISFKKI